MVRLALEDRNHIVQVLSRSSLFQSARERRVLLVQAGLEKLLPLLNLEGSPLIIASEMVDFLSAYGYVTFQHEALGRLLNVFKEFTGVVGEDRAFIDNVLVHYHLMSPAKDGPPLVWKEPLPFEEIPEQILGENTLRHIAFLQRGLEVARAVAFVETTRGTGSGFLIGRSLLVTCHHVLPWASSLKSTVFRFNYQLTFDGTEEQAQDYRTHPSGKFHTNPDLDYTLVELEGTPGTDWGIVPLSQEMSRIGERVNVIQHPVGLPKQISFQDNVVEYVDPRVTQYRTATMPGSSGSPVFNNLWQVVALHHASITLVEEGTIRRRNEGINMAAILADIPDHFRPDLQ